MSEYDWLCLMPDEQLGHYNRALDVIRALLDILPRNFVAMDKHTSEALVSAYAMTGSDDDEG